MLKRGSLIFIILGIWLLPEIISATIVNTAHVFYSDMSGSDTCTIIPPASYSIKGKIKDSEGKGVSRLRVELSGDKSAVYWTEEDGYYEVAEIPSGNYRVTPAPAHGMQFEPLSKSYTGLTQDYTEQNFEIVSPPVIPINNLFNPAKGEHTTIVYKLEQRCHVIIKLYNLLGELIITLIDENKDAGSYSIDWFGKNEDGRTV
ncbi:MAG: carboxypeptidase-like regulatory domain-containing protein, partial [Candidatus Desantisbacteria bacterium]